jgi:hypothetical protein
MPETVITDRDLELEFGALLAAVAAERPVIDSGFAARLDEQMAKPRTRRERLTGWRPSPALAGGLATAAAAIAVAVPVALHDSPSSSTSATPTGSAPATVSSGAAAKQAAPAEDVAPVPPIGGSAGSVAPQARSRAVERSATVTLATPAGKVETAADRVVALTDEVGGIVISSNVSSGDDASGASANFDLRIPTARLRTFLRELSGVAHVRSRSQSSTDVTRETIDARERLADARAERTTLLRLLARAKSANETAALRTRLRIAAAEIAAARAGVRALGERTSLAAVTVTIEADATAGSGNDRDRLLPGLAIAGGAFVLGLLTWLLLSRATRRRREAVLGA